MAQFYKFEKKEKMKQDKLAVFDLETTGVDIEKDRIVSICIKTSRIGAKESKTVNMMVNPTVPIPESASEVHGITDDMVKDKPTFAEVAREIYELVHGHALMGYNSDRFDVPMLNNEFARAGLSIDWNPVLIDIYKMHKAAFPRTLSSVYRRMTGKEMRDAHNAEADVDATVEIASILIESLFDENASMKEMELYCNGGMERADLSGKFSFDGNGVLVWNIGKNRGKDVKLDMPYVEWFMRADFPEESKKILQEYIKNSKR